MQTDYGSSSLSQRVAAEWFENGLYQQHMETARTELRTRRKVMLNALETYAEDIATWTNPEGGFFIWVHIQPSVSMKSLYSRALKEEYCLIPEVSMHKKPAVIFGFLTPMLLYQISIEALKFLLNLFELQV